MKMILNTISFLALIVLCGINFVASESRALNTFTSPNLVEIFSISDTTNITKWSNFSVYEFSFSTLSAPLFRFATLQKQTDTVAAFAFRVGILALVEYNDTIPIENSTSFIDFPQYGMQWSKFNESDQNPGIKEFDTSLVIKNTTGNNPTNISISAFIASNTTNFQGTVLSPSKLKYTLSFTNYPYQYQNSSIAIIKSVFYASGALFTNSQSAFTINATNDTAGDFSWSGTVLADGKNTSITVEDDVIWQKSQNLTGQNVSPNNATNSIIAQANETFLLLAFKINAVQPKSVVWDPSIGLLNSTGNPSDNSTNSSGTNPSSTSGNTSKSIGTKLVYQTSLLSYLILGAIMIIFF